MYCINGYEFDSERLLLFKDTVSRDIISKVCEDYDVENCDIPIDLQLNPDDMSMRTIAVNSAGICLSFNCNLRCQYCGYSSDENNIAILTLEDVKVFVRDIVKRRTIKKLITKKNDPLEVEFTGGGEPTYDWKLFCGSIKYIKTLCEENDIPLRIRLTTNGMLSDEQVDFIAENVNHVMVSYDGLPNVQNVNRISIYEKGSSERVENTIRRLTLKGVPINIRSTVWQDDFDKMEDMYRYICSLVEPRRDVVWSLYPVLFEGRAVKRIQKQKEMKYTDFFAACLKLMNNKAIKDGDSGVRIDFSFFNSSVYPFFCGAHRATKPWLLPDRSIVTCIESKDDKTFIGVIENNKVNYYEKYKDSLLSIAQEKYYACRECIAYATCKGGCPIWHLRTDDKVQDPLECKLQKEYWKNVVASITVGEYSMGWQTIPIEVNGVVMVDCYKLVKERE